MNTTEHHPSNTSHRELAAGVLKQAENDLRRFHRGTSKVERELYLDAYRWVMSDDCSLPFSFLTSTIGFCAKSSCQRSWVPPLANEK